MRHDEPDDKADDDQQPSNQRDPKSRLRRRGGIRRLIGDTNRLLRRLLAQGFRCGCDRSKVCNSPDKKGGENDHDNAPLIRTKAAHVSPQELAQEPANANKIK